MIDCAPDFKGIAYGVDDLLTTRQLQDLLQVDRVTIYRMLDDGRLRGFKVGGQWRFSRREIEAWLQEQQTKLDSAGTVPPLGRTLAPTIKTLPLSCVQAIQDVCAEVLDIASITVDLEGNPLTDISHSCPFCDLILSTEEGRRRCATAWRSVGDGSLHLCHAGLSCVSAPIEVGGQPVAITAGCQFTGGPWPVHLDTLAADLALDPRDLEAAAGSGRLVPDETLTRISRLLQRIAGTFSEIGEERLNLLSRLQHIAEMSKI
jgi:excisionase family DNA binding protein